MDMRKLVRFVFILSAVRCPTGGHATCPVGFMPPDCQERCSSGMYGVNCASMCPATCLGRSCNPDTGFCYRCQAGFTGPKCSLTCRGGFFGQDCKRLCPINCFKNVCDPFTGFCERCLRGYGGVTCERGSVLRNSSVPSEMVDGNDVSGRMKSTSKSIVVYVLVVVVACILPVCAVALCVKCAKKHSSRKMQLGDKVPSSSHTPILLSTHPRRHGRLALKYQQMQTIEEESSNQFTLDDDIHRRAASNTAVASPTSLNSHDSFHNPSQKYAIETSQAATLHFTKLTSAMASPCNCQERNLFSNVSNASFDFSQPTQGIHGVEVSHVYSQPQNVCMERQSNPTLNLCSDAVSNLIFTDATSQKSAPASCHDNEEYLYEREGSVVSFNSQTPRRVPCSATAAAEIEPVVEFVRCTTAAAGAHVEPVSETARCVVSTAEAAVHAEQGDQINPETMVHISRSECSSSSQECVPGQGHTEDSGPAELVWHQAQAIRQLDNSDGDMVALDSPSETEERNQENTAHEAATPPGVEKKIPACPEATHSVCQQTHSSNKHVADTNTFPELLKSKMAGVAIETIPPRVSNETHKYKQREVELDSQYAPSPGEHKVPTTTLPSTQSHCHNTSGLSQTAKLDTPVVAAVRTGDRNGTLVDRKQRGHEFNQRKGRHAGRAEKDQTDILVDIGEREPDVLTGSTSGLVNFLADRHITAADSCAVCTAVSSAASTAVSTAVSSAVCIPICIPVCISVPIPVSTPISIPVSTGVTTAVLHCCKVRGEGQFLVGGSAQDTACRRVHSFDYTHLSVRHAFDCRTGGYQVSPGTPPHDLAAEEGNQQTPPVAAGHPDQLSLDVCKRAGEGISSSTDHASTASSVPINGSANNMNRLNIRARYPASSCTTSSLTPARDTRHTPPLPRACDQQMPHSILQDKCLSQTPLFSISSSAPMKLSVTYCKDGPCDETPMCSLQVPRYFSLSSLGVLDECPAESRDPIEVSVLVSSPPKHGQKKGPQRNDTEEHSQKRGPNRNDTEEHSQKKGPKRHDTEEHSQKRGPNRNDTEEHSQKKGPKRNDTEEHSQKRGPNRNDTEEHIQKQGPKRHDTEEHNQKQGPNINDTEEHIQKKGPKRHDTEEHSQKQGPNINDTEEHIQKKGPKRHDTEEHIQKQGPKRHDTEEHNQKQGPNINDTEEHIQKKGPKRHDTEEHSLKKGPKRHDTEEHNQKQGPNRNDTEEHSQNLQKHTCLPSGERDGSHPRQSSAFKCDQFQQVIYTQEHQTPFRHRTTLPSHLSAGTNSGITPRRLTRWETPCAVVNTTDATRSYASNPTRPIVPVYRALDENPIRTNVTPETRHIESLTPLSAIKMSLTQTPDRDILQICTSNGGAETLPSSGTENQATQHDELVPAVNPCTDYIKGESVTNKYVSPYRSHLDRPHLDRSNLDRRDSGWSTNPRFLFMQELAHDGNLRQQRRDELSQACSFPTENLLQPRAVPTDDTRHLAQMMVLNTPSSTPSQTSGESICADNSTRNESSHGAGQRPLTVSSYYPDLWQLGSRQDNSCPATVDHLCPVVSNDSCVAVLSAGGRQEGSTSTSRDDRQTGGQMIQTPGTVQGNRLISDDRYQSGPVGQTFTPNAYQHYIYHEHNSRTLNNYVHRSTSRGLMQQNLQSAELDQLTLYPLPSLLEELAIWEGSVPAVVANTKPCLLPAGHGHLTVAHSVIERPVRTTTDDRSGPPGSDVLYSDLCCQNSEFTQYEVNRLKLEPTMYSGYHNTEGCDCSVMVEQKRAPHTDFDTFCNYDRLSYCCKSTAGKQASQEKPSCCRNDSSEYMSLHDDASDVFFDALDSFPLASDRCPSSRQRAHNQGPIKTATDRKRAVKFVQTSRRYSSDVDFSTNKARDQVSERQWRDGNNMGNERLHYRLDRQQTPQPNIAFRFAVPRCTDSTTNTSHKSLTKTGDRKRHSKQMHLTGGKDLAGDQPSDRHEKVTPAQLSVYEQTEQRTRPFTKKHHTGRNISSRIVGVEGTDSAFHRSVFSDKDACSLNDQHSVAEDFFSSRE